MGNASSFIKKSSYVLDPDGEVTIILRSPNAPSAVSKFQQSSESGSEDADSETESNHEQMGTGEAEGGGIEGKGHVDASSNNPSQNKDDKKNEEVRFQVSAKHLTVASPVFRISRSRVGTQKRS
ncbi:hypothetical protein N8T08_006181 [Aspergillus melleus]|uniref:Uncharacterized protein n=1 Tax=Aspergillus melleus TaxID=138277 RepID=A0ACC3AZW7_9EURO|nr:hypothetical protein N8T08_006181 [Aspergillus melleus]